MNSRQIPDEDIRAAFEEDTKRGLRKGTSLKYPRRKASGNKLVDDWNVGAGWAEAKVTSVSREQGIRVRIALANEEMTAGNRHGRVNILLSKEEMLDLIQASQLSGLSVQEFVLQSVDQQFRQALLQASVEMSSAEFTEFAQYLQSGPGEEMPKEEFAERLGINSKRTLYRTIERLPERCVDKRGRRVSLLREPVEAWMIERNSRTS